MLHRRDLFKYNACLTKPESATLCIILLIPADQTGVGSAAEAGFCPLIAAALRHPVLLPAVNLGVGHPDVASETVRAEVVSTDDAQVGQYGITGKASSN